ncbi:flotillin family protein, partial [Parageobacillus sp. SY1]
VVGVRGRKEGKKKKNVRKALERYGQAAILDMIIKMLPEYAKQVASPLANIDKITIVDTGSNSTNGGANRITGYATNLMASLQETLKASTGIDVKQLLENFAAKGNVEPPSIQESEDAVEQRKTAGQ